MRISPGLGRPGGAEEEVEGGAEFAGDLAFVGDEELLEERLVDQTADPGRRGQIGAVKIGDQCEGVFQVALDEVEVEFESSEPFFEERELAADLGLLDFQ